MNEINTLKQGDEFVIPNGFTEEQTIKMIAKKYDARLFDFKSSKNKIIYSPIKIGFVPKGHDVISVWNEKEKKYKFYLRPIEGFSEKYLNDNTFVPKKEKEEEIEFGECLNENYASNGENKTLRKAKKEKNDEFYTRLEDVVNELKHYKEHFRDKIVYCPCDKVYNKGRSAFSEYFISQFHSLGIKKLICTQYNPNGPGTVEEIDFNGEGVVWNYEGEENDSQLIDESKINTRLLIGNGSFDSDECVNIMKKCDIVVTNPPFSLFRNFLNQILSLNKKFLIIGNMNAITYKEIFPLIKSNEIWLGYGFKGDVAHFYSCYKDVATSVDHKEGMIRVSGVTWYTNLEHNKRHELLYLCENYSPEKYPKYDNYDAIEVSKTKNIPVDYDGIMGVPITFLEKYNPEQFEIIGLMSGAKCDGLINGNDGRPKFYVNGKGCYARILIRKIC